MLSELADSSGTNVWLVEGPFRISKKKVFGVLKKGRYRSHQLKKKVDRQ